MGFNKVILQGNLTRDVELSYIQNGSALGKTAIAANRKYNVNGTTREDVCFIDITFWGRTAEVANQYLKKGSSILIEGRLQFDQWQDQNGQNRSKHSIVVESMQMLGGSGGNQNQGGQNNYQQNQGNNQGQGGNYNQRPQQGNNNYQQRPQNNGGAAQQQNNYQQNGNYNQGQQNNYQPQQQNQNQQGNNNYPGNDGGYGSGEDEVIPF